MSTQITQNRTVIAEWSVQEFEVHTRGAWWYFGATLVGGLLVVGALLTDNYLFALIVLLIVVLTIFYERRGSQTVTFRLLESGVELGSQFVPYADVDHFFILEREGLSPMLYVAFRAMWRPRWNVSVEGQSTSVIQKCLRRYVREEVEEAHEPFADIISRVFKL